MAATQSEWKLMETRIGEALAVLLLAFTLD